MFYAIAEISFPFSANSLDLFSILFFGCVANNGADDQIHSG